MKLIDVYPDGTAYNLDETIQRLRYRNGYDKPPVWMEAGKVYRVKLQPMTTSNYFAAGHRIRIKGMVAHNAVYHSRQYPSKVTLTVVKQAN